VCCSVLQCVAVCCSVLHCVAVCCSVLQCVAVCYSLLQCVGLFSCIYCSVLQCVAVCFGVLWAGTLFCLLKTPYFSEHYSFTKYPCICISMLQLQRTISHFNILQHIATYCNILRPPSFCTQSCQCVTLQHAAINCNTR